ncbi:MAG: response regulator transcription factor [Acidobacteriaceae bacterium]
MDRVLIIDDDVELCDLIAEFLKEEGFGVQAVHDPESGLARLSAENFSIVILDVMLPKFNGFELLRRLRSTGNNVPVLLLTARGEEVDRIVGLEIGADDYLAKPFNTRELTARLRAILRRTGQAAAPPSTSGALHVGDVELNPSNRTVKREGKVVDLTSVEFDLLRELMRNAGQVVSREDLSSNVLGRPFSPFDRSIDMHVSKLRRKLGERNGEDSIRTIRNAGYLFPLDLEASAEQSS